MSTQDDYEAFTRRLIKLDDIGKLHEVNEQINAIRFTSDQAQFGVKDYWQTPMEMILNGAGDCEDYAIAKYFTLSRAGFPEHRMRITYCKAKKLNNAAHMVLIASSPHKQSLVLDNLVPNILPAHMRNDLQPVYAFNRDDLWAGEKRIADADKLDLWRNLINRMEKHHEL